MNIIPLETLDVIQPLSFEENKIRILEFMNEINPDIVMYESSDEMVMLEAFAYELTYGDERFNARMRAVLPSYAKGDNLDGASLNFYGLSRLPGESDEAFYDRSLASLQQSVTTGSDDSYIAHTKAVDSRITHVYPYRSGEGETTIVWYSSVEQKEEELTALQTAIESVLFSTKRRSLCATRQTVVRAEVVYFDVSLTLVVSSVLKANQLIADARVALQNYYRGYDISKEVHLSKITSLVHLPGVVDVLMSVPAADVVIGKEQVAVLREINIQTQEVQDV